MEKDRFVPPTRELALLAQNPTCARLRLAVAASDGFSTLREFARQRHAERPDGESALATTYGARFETKLLRKSGKPGTLLAELRSKKLVPPNASIVDLRSDGNTSFETRLKLTRYHISKAAQGKVKAHLLLHPALEFDPKGARWPLVPDALIFSKRFHGFRPIEIKSFPYLGGRSSIDGIKIALLQVAAASLALEEQERFLQISRPKRGSFGRATLILANPNHPWRMFPLWDVALGAERDHLRTAVIPALREGLWRVAGEEVTPDQLEKSPSHFCRDCYRCPAYRACRQEARQQGDLAMLGDAAKRLVGIRSRKELSKITRGLCQGNTPNTHEEKRIRRALRIVRSIRAGGAPALIEAEEEEGNSLEEVELLLRLEAASRNRAVLTRGVQEIPLSSTFLSLSIAICPYENRLWGYALAKGESAPVIRLSLDPKGAQAELELLSKLQNDLVLQLTEEQNTFPQVLLASSAELEFLALLSSRCHSRQHAKLKAILHFLLDKAEEDLSATLVIATLLLKRQFRAGQPPQDDLHLGVSLVWADAYFSGDDARTQALEAERIPVGPRLSPEEEDLVAKCFAEKASVSSEDLAQAESILRTHVTRNIALSQKAVSLVLRLALPTPLHHQKMIERSREGVIRLLERLEAYAQRGYWFTDPSPYRAASRYLARVADRYSLEFWSREGDLRAALEAEDTGRGEPVTIRAIDGQLSLILFSCRRRTSRLREGDHLAIRGFAGRLSGILREIRTPPGDVRQIVFELKSGQRLLPTLAVGKEVFLHPTSMAAMAFRKQSLLKESRARLPWLFNPREKLPPAIPRGAPLARTLPLSLSSEEKDSMPSEKELMPVMQPSIVLAGKKESTPSKEKLSKNAKSITKKVRTHSNHSRVAAKEATTKTTHAKNPSVKYCAKKSAPTVLSEKKPTRTPSRPGESV